jgi:hypothetical protein
MGLLLDGVHSLWSAQLCGKASAVMMPRDRFPVNLAHHRLGCKRLLSVQTVVDERVQTDWRDDCPP